MFYGQYDGCNHRNSLAIGDRLGNTKTGDAMFTYFVNTGIFLSHAAILLEVIAGKNH